MHNGANQVLAFRQGARAVQQQGIDDLADGQSSAASSATISWTRPMR